MTMLGAVGTDLTTCPPARLAGSTDSAPTRLRRVLPPASSPSIFGLGRNASTQTAQPRPHLGMVVMDRHRRWRRTEGARKLRALHAAAGRLLYQAPPKAASTQPV